MHDENTPKNNKFSDFLHKATDVSKKVAVNVATNVQDGASNLSEKMKQDSYERRLKKYNPLFAKEYKSRTFKLPEIIKVVSGADRRDVDVCQGAIGWRESVNNVEVLCLYKDFAEECGLTFAPSPKNDNIYYVDSFDRSVYIGTDRIFGRAKDEKLAELEHIAFSLGAKSCYIEIIESDTQIESSHSKMKSSINHSGVKAEVSASNEINQKNVNKQSGKTRTYFSGSNEPVRPTLKWFKDDKNINNLIDMRCSNANSAKSKTLEIEGSSFATMTQNTACAIDLLSKSKNSMSVEKQAMKELYSKLIFEIEF